MKIGSYEVTFAPKDGDDILEKIKEFRLDTVIINYIHAEIPRVSVKFLAIEPNDLLSNIEWKIKISTEGSQSFEFNFLATKKTISGSTVVLTGFTCTAEYMMIAKTLCLGTSLSDALATLNPDFTLNIDTKVNNDDGFYCINETPYQATLRLLRGVSPDSIWEYTENEINLIDPSLSTKIDPGTLRYIKSNPVSQDEAEPYINSSNFGSQAWMKSSQVESFSADFVTNYVNSIKLRKTYDILYGFSYSMFIPNVLVGQQVEMEYPSIKAKSFGLIGKVIRFDRGKFTSDLILGANL